MVVFGFCFVGRLVVIEVSFYVFVFGFVVVQLNDKDFFVGVFRFRVKMVKGGRWVVGWGVVGG